jgi:hypothetical protein
MQNWNLYLQNFLKPISMDVMQISPDAMQI